MPLWTFFRKGLGTLNVDQTGISIWRCFCCKGVSGSTSSNNTAFASKAPVLRSSSTTELLAFCFLIMKVTNIVFADDGTCGRCWEETFFYETNEAVLVLLVRKILWLGPTARVVVVETHVVEKHFEKLNVLAWGCNLLLVEERGERNAAWRCCVLTQMMWLTLKTLCALVKLWGVNFCRLLSILGVLTCSADQ